MEGIDGIEDSAGITGVARDDALTCGVGGFASIEVFDSTERRSVLLCEMISDNARVGALSRGGNSGSSSSSSTCGSGTSASSSSSLGKGVSDTAGER